MNPGLIKQFLNSDLAQPLDLHMTEQANAILTQIGVTNAALATTDDIVDQIRALVGNANPAAGDTANIMNFLKLLYNQLGQDDPVSADRTSVMNYLKLLEANFPKDSSAFTPGIRAMGLDVGATNNGLTLSNNTMTPTNTPFAGYLHKSLSCINLDRLTFPKIYKPANTKCQVDVCGGVITSAPTTTISSQAVTLQGGVVLVDDFEVVSNNSISSWTSSVVPSGSSIDAYTSWKTQGTSSVRFTTGSTAVLTSTKYFDFTNVSNLLVDINVIAQGTGGVFSLAIDGVAKITKSTNGISLNQAVDTSGYTGVHSVTIGTTAGTLGIVAFDNLRMTFPTVSATTDFYKDDIVVVTSGAGAGQTRKITAYNGTTKVATLDQAWTTTPTTASGFVLYDGIASNVSPGYDLKTINYVTYPTINVICSLEKQAGATESPSMGVPVVTSIEKDWVSQAPVTGRSMTTTNTTLLSTSGRTRLDCLSGGFVGNGYRAYLTVICDSVKIMDNVIICIGDLASYAPINIPLSIESNSSIEVQIKVENIAALMLLTASYSK